MVFQEERSTVPGAYQIKLKGKFYEYEKKCYFWSYFISIYDEG